MDDLRPSDWEAYVGQTRLKRELQVHIDSAIAEGKPLDHILLCGPAGAGKTSIASIIASRLGEPFEVLTMPVSEQALMRLVSNHDGIVLLDEIHRASKKEQEALLPLLEFGYVQNKAGRKFHAPWLTVVGATTDRQGLIDPLVDRFPIRPEFDEYSEAEMALIVNGMAVRAGVEMSEDTAQRLGSASAGVPRQARKLVVAYGALANSLGRTPEADEVLELCRTESDGLTALHMRYLETLLALGGSKGLSVLSSLLREPPSVLQELERTLVGKGFVTFGERGRELTQEGIRRAGGGRQRNPRRVA